MGNFAPRVRKTRLQYGRLRRPWLIKLAAGEAGLRGTGIGAAGGTAAAAADDARRQDGYGEADGQGLSAGAGDEPRVVVFQRPSVGVGGDPERATGSVKGGTGVIKAEVHEGPLVKVRFFV